jgi:hypothetical protein
MMGKDSAPPVDYAAQAQAQADASKDTAQYNNNANRVDQYSPTGSLTWSIRPGADPKNPQPGDYIQTTAYSPSQQQAVDAQSAITNQLMGTAQAGLGRASEAMATPFDTSKLPAMQNAPGIVQNAQAGQGMAAGAPQAGALTSNINTAGMPALASDYGAQRDQVVNSLMSRINPDMAASRETMDTNLANKGIELGSTAYGRAQDLQGRKENDALMGATLAGSQEQSRLEGLALADRNAMFSEGSANANLANSAQSQAYSQGLAGAQFQNQSQAQNFSQNASQDATINALLGRNATFDNQSRQQQIQEQAYLRQLPLNEINALRTGNQTAAPSFSNYYTSGATAAPIMDAAMAQGSANSAQNAQNSSSTNAALASAASIAAMMMFSDRRLKKNLRRLGRHPVGVDRYSWDWADDSGSSHGVIAQELLEIRPDAVVSGADGWLRVRYDLIGGQ